MKCLVPLLLLGLAITPLRAAESPGADAVRRVTAANAKDHIGYKAVVTGTVVEVYRLEKLVRLNFEKRFPNQPFTAIVYSNKTNLFPNLDAYKGKRVEVTGKIVEYRDRPEMVLTNTTQIKVLENSVAAGDNK